MTEAAPTPAKRSLARRLLAWIGIPLGALVLLVALAPTLMPTGWILDRIARESQAVLGAPVTAASVSLGWLSGVTLEDVSLPNARGFSEAPLLRAARVRAKADLAALLSRRIQATVLVEGLEASLERRDGDGAWNVLALVPPPSAAPAGSPAPPAIPVSCEIRLLGRATVIGRGRTVALDDLDLKVSAPSLADRPVSVHLDAKAKAGGAAWDIDLQAQASPFASSPDASVTAALKGKGLGELLAPVLDLPAPLDLGEATLVLSARLEGGRCHAEVREARLQGFKAGDLASFRDATMALSADGPLAGGPLQVSADLAFKDLGLGPKARVRELRLAPRMTLDLAAGRCVLEPCAIAVGPLSGRVEGRAEAAPGKPPTYVLTEAFDGDLARLPEAVSGLIPEGASFTGALRSRLSLIGDGRAHTVDGETVLEGFSIRAPGLSDGPKTDLCVTQKLVYDQEEDRLQVEALHVTAGGEGGPLDLSLSGALEDPKHLGRLDLSGSARADLAKLLAIVSGYFSGEPGLDCRGRVEGQFSARGRQGQATVKGTLSLSGGRFSGGPFGASPLSIPEGRLAADMDLDREDGLRVAVRSVEASTPFLGATFRDGFLALPKAGDGKGGSVKGTLEVAVRDLDATARFLRGSVPALRPYELAGSASLRAQLDGSLSKARVTLEAGLGNLSVSAPGTPLGPLALGRGTLKAEATGPLLGPWTLPVLCVDLSALRASAPLPGPVDLAELRLDVRGATVETSGPAFSAESLELRTPLATLSCKAASASLAPPLRLALDELEASADLSRCGALLAAWKLAPPGLQLSGTASLSRGKASGSLDDLRVACALSVGNLRVSGGPLGRAVLAERAVAVEGLSARLSIPKRSLSLDGPLVLKAPGLGLTRLSLASLSLGDWSDPKRLKAGPLEVELEAAQALAASALFSPALSGIGGSGPVSLRVGALQGDGKTLSAEVTLDAGAAALSLDPVAKKAGDPLSLSVQAALTADALCVSRAELTLKKITLGLDPGSVIPLDPSRDARVRLRKSLIALADLRDWLPQLKDVSGSVSLEGALEGPLTMPALKERLKPDLSLSLQDIALSYRAQDGKDVPVKASGTLRVTRASVAADLACSVGGEALRVTADLKDPLAAPAGTLTVSGGSFDLDRLLTLKPKSAAGTSAPPLPPRPSAPSRGTGLLPSPFDRADLELVLALKGIAWKGNTLSALSSKTTLRNGRLASETTAAVNEGPIRIGLDLDASQKDPPLSIALEATEVRLDIEMPKTVRYFLPVLAGGKGIQGKLTLSPVRLEGHGADWETLQGNLHTVEDGRLKVGSGKVEAAPFMKALGNAIGKPELADLRFDTIESVFSIRDRTISNQTLVKGNQGEIRSSGWVRFDGALEQRSLLSGEMLQTANPAANEALSDLMGEGGILTEGSIENPRTTLDLASAIRKRLEKEAKKQLGRALEERLKGLLGR